MNVTSKQAILARILAGAFFAIGVGTLHFATEGGVTSIGIALLAFLASVGFIAYVARLTPGPIFRKSAKIGIAVYLAVVLISIVGALGTGHLSASDLVWFAPLSFVAWAVWGVIAVFLLGVPLWAAWKGIAWASRRAGRGSDA
jgi:hypothetical protein